MAEQNQEITYIPYGQDEISQQDLMTSLANGIEGYLGSKRWARKDKYRNAWLAAYQDIINHGLTGASNETGVWTVNHGQSPIDLNNKSNTEREMYQDAAYYIQQKMSQMTPRKKEEEKKKEDLEKFGSFKDNLMKRILNRRYGGTEKENQILFLDSEQGWDAQDTRGADGLRGTKNRKAAMIAELKAYKKDLDNQDLNYNFEGTSFKDKADLQTKIQAAIDALENTPKDESDDLPAFSALGLPYRAFFSNGGNDIYETTKDGKQVTYQQHYENQQKEAQEKQKAEQEKLKAQLANYWSGYKYYDLSKYNGRPLTSEESNIKHLNEIISKDKWSGDEASQIVQAFKLAERNGKLVPITDKNELSKFGPMWKNRVKQLRKINEIDGIYYDTVGKKFVKPYKNGQTPQTSFQDILNQNNPETIAKKKADSDQKLREQYAERTEMTPQDWEYVASIVPDIASIPDTEPFSAAALAFTGAGMRHHALANRPGGMSTSDKWWQAADYLGAGLAAIPGFGDAYLVGRILNTTRKFATGLFAAAGAYGLGSATVNAFGKWAKGEDMTLQEKMDVVMAIPSLVSAYRLRSREGLNDAAKAANQNNITTNKGKVKVTVTDESGNKSVKEITGLSEQKSKELQKQFKNAGNDNSKKTQILKSDSEIQAKASEQGIDLNKVSIETDSRHMASYRKPTEIEFYPETSPSSARARYNQEIENLKNSGHSWQARRLQIYDKFYKGTGGARKESNGNWFKKAWHYVTDTSNQEFANRIKNGETPKTTNSAETPKTAETKSNWSQEKIDKYQKNLEQMESSFLDRGKYNPSSKSQEKIDLSKNISSEKYSLADGKQLELSMNNGILNIKGPDGINVSQRVHDQLEVKKVIADIIKNYNNSIGRSSASIKRFSKEYIESLKELRRKGYLFKQGGALNNPHIDTIIEDFIKNNNI